MPKGRGRRNDEMPATDDFSTNWQGEIYSGIKKSRNGVPLTIHNAGGGTGQNDRLFSYNLTGHYRLIDASERKVESGSRGDLTPGPHTTGHTGLPPLRSGHAEVASQDERP
jgi:hypothetical protein